MFPEILTTVLVGESILNDYPPSLEQFRTKKSIDV